MSERPQRLTDKQVAEVDHWPIANGHMLRISDLAREVQMWRALVNGGLCPTCGGTRVVYIPDDAGHEVEVRDCADCTDGRTPGLIERLEAIAEYSAPNDIADDLTTVIAELRKAVGNE